MPRRIFNFYGACGGTDIQADIRLVVAAPELLDALEVLVNRVLVKSAIDSDEDAAAFDQAIAAIKKARQGV